MKRRVLVGLALLGISCVASAADKCGWLATSEVDKAFPEYAPWKTITGGKVGSCQFTSDPHRAPNIFGANQMVESSAAEAVDLVRSMKAEMVKDYDVQAVPTMGKEGFRYKPKSGSGESSDRSLFYVLHKKNVVVLGSLNLQAAITPAQREAGEKLLAAALSIADDSSALKAATSCPYFDAAIIKRLLPGKDFNQNMYGSNSCMAQAGEKVVIFSIIENGDPEQLAKNMTEGGCKSEPVPSLGNAATIAYNCTGGNPRATVRYVSGKRLLDFSLAPGHEPTAADRALLIDLAGHALAK